MAKEYAIWSFPAGPLMRSEITANNQKSITIPKLNELAKEGWRVVANSVVKGEDNAWKLICTLEKGDYGSEMPSL